MPFIESKDEKYLVIKKTNKLSQGELEFLSYLYRFGPSTTNELIDKVEQERKGELSRNELDLMDRKPAELKKWGVIKTNERRKCKSTGKSANTLIVTNQLPERKLKLSPKAKNIIDSSMNSALLAVEVYNKPRATFRSEAYISLMIIAWTKAFHSFFRATIGDKYYRLDEKGKPILAESGEKQTWSLQECMNKYSKLKEEVRKNIEFFIPLRNKIEHAFVNSKEVDTVIFGECQSLLMNYENFVVENFGGGYALNESLAFSLQFSKMRTNEQGKASRSLQLPQVKDLYDYIETYRKGLPEPVLASQEYRVKVMLVPVVSGSRTTDLAVDFLSLQPGQSINADTLKSITKERVIEKEVVGKGTLTHHDVFKRVNERMDKEILNQTKLTELNFVFSVKPSKWEGKDLGGTNRKYCEYHHRFKRYQFTQKYVDDLCIIFEKGRLDMDNVHRNYKVRKKMMMKDYLE